jgi:hypothetical protein
MLTPELPSSHAIPESFFNSGTAVLVTRLFDFQGIGGKMSNCEKRAVSIHAGRAKPSNSGYPAMNGCGSTPIPADERDAAIRGLLTKRSEARRRRAALANELRLAGKSLYDLGGALKHASGNTIGNRVDHILPKLESVPAVCDLGRLKLMLEELKEVERWLAQLDQNASEIGID